MPKQENDQDEFSRARAVALRLLARREHSRQELSVKMRQRKFAGDVIRRVLDEYEERGWLDDHRFAELYARQRMELGYGPLRIQGELQQRGIHFTPENMQDMTEEDWCRNAILARDKRYGLADLSGDWDEKARQARFLGRRGFSASQIERALDEVVSCP